MNDGIAGNSIEKTALKLNIVKKKIFLAGLVPTKNMNISYCFIATKPGLIADADLYL